MLTHRQVMDCIISCLSVDLLEPKWAAMLEPGDPVESGHCCIASEALYHLAGGREAGFKSVVCPYLRGKDGKIYFGHLDEDMFSNKETHWWIVAPLRNKAGAGEILDVTVKQYTEALEHPAPFNYSMGRNCAFMRQDGLPSHRARTLMDRVISKLGISECEQYKMENINSFCNPIDIWENGS